MGESRATREGQGKGQLFTRTTPCRLCLRMTLLGQPADISAIR